jgi:hypothetical protein
VKLIYIYIHGTAISFGNVRRLEILDEKVIAIGVKRQVQAYRKQSEQ